MWIHLIKKLPTEISPPKMSWHWATPWPMTLDKKTARKAKLRLPEDIFDSSRWGEEPDYDGAVGIIYKEERIRVFPHEFSVNNELFKDLYNDNLLIFHPMEVGAELPDLNKTQHVLKEHALVDGCDDFQATMVALGKNFDDIELPPAGWYELRREIALIYCDKWELEYD